MIGKYKCTYIRFYKRYQQQNTPTNLTLNYQNINTTLYQRPQTREMQHATLESEA